MLYRKMPKNDDELSILGFGCMRFPVNNDGSIDTKKATEQIRLAIDLGVNYLDTAWPYHNGESEPFLGKALEDGYREKVKIATKLPTWMIKSRSDMDYYLDRQLKKLRTDNIDYYKLKGLNVTDFLDQAVTDGRIVNAGFSFHGLAEDFIRIIDEYPWIFCQIQYNFLDRENQAGLSGLRYAASKNMGVVIMEPLRGGNIGLPVAPTAVAEIWNQAEKKRTPVEWALRWIWNHPEVTTVLSGMNEVDHIEENIAIANDAEPGSLAPLELKLVEKVVLKYQELMKVACTGCGYCMPCPEGVMIPAIFEVYNKMHMFGDETAARFSYALRMSGEISGHKPGFASQCVECGECMDKCPQQLGIIDDLAAACEEMESGDLQDRVKMVTEKIKVR